MKQPSVAASAWTSALCYCLTPPRNACPFRRALGLSGTTIRSSSKAGTSASVAGAVGIPVGREAEIGRAVATALGSDHGGAVAVDIVLSGATPAGDRGRRNGKPGGRSWHGSRDLR